VLEFSYQPEGQTLVDFMNGEAFVRGLRGPIGSGKSVCCVVELFRLALAQEQAIDPKTGRRTGWRKVRTGVIRNTTPQLETTTIKTWLEWLPENEFGPMRWRPPYRHSIRIPELMLDWEVWFLALDRDEDVRKLLSFEFTNIWINEARELSRSIITAAASRLDRYPRQIEGGATRACMIMDTNAPDEEHWWSIMSGAAPVPDWMSEEDRMTLIKPDNWEFYTQPPAMLDVVDAHGNLTGYRINPNRDNRSHTTARYYENLISGQTRDWILNMVQNQIGRTFAGRPVYRDFNEKVHVAPEPIIFDPSKPLHVGVDFGRTPAAAVCQMVHGQFRTIAELVTKDMNATQFAPLLRGLLNEKFPGGRFVLTGDPAGENDNEVVDTTPMRIFRANGLEIKPAWSNDPTIRIGAIQTQINTMVEGQPGYIVGPDCKYVLNAKKGGYCYKKDREEIDKKSIYSHISDAEQYAALGMGLGKALIGVGTAKRVAQQANIQQSVFDRRKGITPRQSARMSVLSRGFGGKFRP
jgi:hypothetical protein